MTGVDGSDSLDVVMVVSGSVGSCVDGRMTVDSLDSVEVSSMGTRSSGNETNHVYVYFYVSCVFILLFIFMFVTFRNLVLNF